MPGERAFWLLLVTFLIVGVAASPMLRRPYQFQLAPAAEGPGPESQPRSERVWRHDALGAADLRLRFDAAGLSRPTLLTTGGDGRLFVVDSDDVSVKEFSASGEPLRTLGGRGERPGQFLNPSDVAVSAAGEVWVSDLRAPRVTVFGRDGALARTIELEHPASRLVPDAEGGVVVLVPDAEDHLFAAYGPDGERRARFGRLFAEGRDNALTLNGWLAGDGAGGLVLALLHTDWIIAFDRDGGRSFLREAITPHPMPTVDVAADGSMRIPREAPLASLSASVAGDEIFLLRRDREKGLGFVDVYGLADGTYRESLALPPSPSPPRYLHVTECCVYALSRDEIVRWPFSR